MVTILSCEKSIEWRYTMSHFVFIPNATQPNSCSPPFFLLITIFILLFLFVLYNFLSIIGLIGESNYNLFKCGHLFGCYAMQCMLCIMQSDSQSPNSPFRQDDDYRKGCLNQCFVIFQERQPSGSSGDSECRLIDCFYANHWSRSALLGDALCWQLSHVCSVGAADRQIDAASREICETLL